MSERVAVVVYGATGFTGRLVCAELARRRVAFVAAGRDERKLRALADSLGGIATAVAALDDAGALERLAARGRVVLDCAGPFVRWGRAVQNAALAAQSHFLDITGEHVYMRATHERDAEARARDIALVNAVGFDVVPTDAAAVLAAEAAGAPVTRVRIAFSARGARPTQGTLRSALDAAHLGSLAWIDGEFRREPVAAERMHAPFPPPIGPRACISVPWGDVVTAPRSTGAREVRTFMAFNQGPLLKPLARIAGALLGVGAIKSWAERRIARWPEGPGDGERARSSFAVWAEAEGARGRRAVWITGGNGYDFTAASAALCAERAAAADFTARGALTPTQAFGARALLDGLADSGVRWGAAE